MRRQAWHRSSGYRHCLSVLAILALAMRSLIPTGYMIAPVDGHAQLVLCPAGVHIHHASGMHHMAGAEHLMTGLDHPADAAHAAGLGHSADACPFALAGGAGLASLAPAPTLPYFIELQHQPVVTFVVVAKPPPLRFLAPRGPPILV